MEEQGRTQTDDVETVTYHLRNDADSDEVGGLSNLFRILAQAKNAGQFEDFSVSRPTLEHVFLHVT